MKAAQITEYGGPDVVHITEVAKPTAGDGQVLVEVYASSINPFDAKIRQGVLKDQLQLPLILGGDISGVVSEVGAGVTHVAVGDKVYGQANAVARNSGAFAEFALTKATEVAAMPGNVDFVVAAASPLTGLSALQALTDHARLQPGQRVLIHGGAGGIGSLAIQLAKSLGAYVATTVREEDMDYAKQLGADECIDYQHQAFDEVLQNFDAVIDTVGGETYRRSFAVLKKGGIIVSLLEHPDQNLMNQYGVSAVYMQVRSSIDSLNALSKYIEDDAIKVQVDRTFPLESIQEAFKTFEGKHVHGKIGIVVKEA